MRNFYAFAICQFVPHVKSEWARILGHFPIVQITQFGTGIAGQLLSVGNHVYYGMYPLFCFHLLQLLSPFVHSVSTFSLSFLFGQFFLLIVLHTIKHRYTLIHRHFYMCHYFVLYISFYLLRFLQIARTSDSDNDGSCCRQLPPNEADNSLQQENRAGNRVSFGLLAVCLWCFLVNKACDFYIVI